MEELVKVITIFFKNSLMLITFLELSQKILLTVVPVLRSSHAMWSSHNSCASGVLKMIRHECIDTELSL